MLPLHFTSAEAKAEARRLQTDSRETMAHEPVMEVVETWLNTHLSQQQIETPGNEDFDDDDPGDALYVRSLITTTMIREELASNPIIRDLRGTGQLSFSFELWRRREKLTARAAGFGTPDDRGFPDPALSRHIPSRSVVPEYVSVQFFDAHL